MLTEARRLELRARIHAEVPERPGVYTWVSRDGEQLYVGKSRNLRKRMLSYLTPGQARLDGRKRHLASAINDFAWRETAGELLALLLEDALIKQLDPRHNERQKDYRERRYLLLTHDAFPTCLVVEGETPRGGTLFGPFKDEYFVQDLITLITDHSGLRACHDAEPFRRSPRYDLGQCPAPCRGAITEDAYAALVAQMRDFLTGDSSWFEVTLEGAMQQASEALRFEEAAALRDQLEFCRRFAARQRFFHRFATETIVVEEPARGLRYQLRAGALAGLTTRHGVPLQVPGELAAPPCDRRFFLDRANLIYAWISRHT